MRIQGSRDISRVGSTAGKSGVSSTSFSDMVSQPRAASVSHSLPLSPLASIIGIAEETPEQERKRKAVRYAADLLAELEGLYRAVCLGTLDKDRLVALSRRLEQTPPPADPQLADLIGQIEVRIAVELARYGS